jgi:hypothetical protein
MKYHQQGDIVRIRWLDACGQDSESSPGEAKTLSPMVVTTVGQVIVHDKKKITVASSSHLDGEEFYRGTLSVPRRMVLSVYKQIDATSAVAR